MLNPARRFVFFWNGVNALLFLLVILHQSTTPDVLGRWARSYVLGVGLSLALVILVLLFSSLWQRRLSTLLARTPPAWSVVTAFALFAAITLLWMTPVDAYVVKVLITFNAASFGMWIVFTGVQNGSGRLARQWHMLLLTTLVAVLVISLFSAHNVPEQQSSGDEPGWTDYAVSWLDTRNIYYRIMDKREVPITPGIGYWLVPYAGWLNTFGVTLASGRLFIWALYTLATLAIAGAGWRLYDRWTGLLAGLCVAASPFVLENRIIRPEIGLPIFGALLLIVYLRKRPVWAVLAGWLAVLSLEVHAAGLAYIAGAAGLYATDLILRRDNPQRLRRFVYFLLGAAVGGILYVLLHILILPDPTYFFETLRAERGFLSGIDLGVYQRAFSIYWGRAPLEIIFFAISLVGLLLRRMESDRILLRFMLFCMVGYFVFVPGAERYLILFAPFVYIGIAAFLRHAFARIPAAPRFAGSGIALFSLCAPFLAQSIPEMRLNLLAADAVPALVQHVRELSDPSALIFGDINTYWWFRDYAGFRANNSEYDHSDAPVNSPDAIWTVKPDVVFFTGYPGMPTLPPKLAQLLQDEQYELVDSFESGGFTTRIWWRPGYLPNQSVGALFLTLESDLAIMPPAANGRLPA